jgi:hypothetical protein
MLGSAPCWLEPGLSGTTRTNLIRIVRKWQGYDRLQVGHAGAPPQRR